MNDFTLPASPALRFVNGETIFSESTHGAIRSAAAESVVVHYHQPTSPNPVCGAPIPEDRMAGLTAYRSDVTCEGCSGWFGERSELKVPPPPPGARRRHVIRTAAAEPVELDLRRRVTEPTTLTDDEVKSHIVADLMARKTRINRAIANAQWALENINHMLDNDAFEVADEYLDRAVNYLHRADPNHGEQS
jgi:hypothetical protein